MSKCAGCAPLVAEWGPPLLAVGFVPIVGPVGVLCGVGVPKRRPVEVCCDALAPPKVGTAP